MEIPDRDLRDSDQLKENNPTSLVYEAVAKTVYVIHLSGRHGSNRYRVQVGLTSHFIFVGKMNLYTRLQRPIRTEGRR